MIIKISALRNSWLKKSVVHKKTYHDRLPWKYLNFFLNNFKRYDPHAASISACCGCTPCPSASSTARAPPLVTVTSRRRATPCSTWQLWRVRRRNLLLNCRPDWKKKRKKRFYLNIIFWVVVVVTFWFNWDEQKSPPLRLYFKTDHLVALQHQQRHHRAPQLATISPISLPFFSFE